MIRRGGEYLKICSGKASDESDDVWKHLKSKERALASEAVAARDRFRYCLNHFFLYKHHLDSKPENRHRRDYLKRVLSPLSAGDRVITLNWDTTAERSLLEHDRWNPMNGYGFRHDLRRPSSYGAPTRPLDFEVLESEVVVLKLHGSVGWHQTRDGRFYFENRYGFLRDFKYTHRGTLIPLTNPEPEPIGPPDGFLLGYPSFLKQVRGPEMQSIWYQAARALETANSVEVWGYSLPQSDTAVRTLLNSLRFATRQTRSQGPSSRSDSGGAVTRWLDFLGGKAEVDGARLE